MILRYFFICTSISLSLFAQSITGTWKITNKTKPYHFASIVSYDSLFRFNPDGTIQLLAKSGSITGSTRNYEFKNNALTVYLKNKNNSGINNFVLGRLSSQTFVLTPINSTCYNGIDTEDGSNTFMMCKSQ